MANTTETKKKYAVLTWGCQMNVDDSDQIENLLEADGMERANGVEDADVIILNTCSVRQKPEDKVFLQTRRTGGTETGAA